MGSSLATSFIRVDGVPLRLGLALPSRPATTAVVIAPGRAEFLEKYDEVVDDLVARDLAVGILEWRGQGLSHRALPNSRKGHIRRFEDYLLDLDDAVRFFDDAGLPRRRVLLGHSMGGHIALRRLTQPHHGFAAGLLTAPMFGINLRGLTPGVASCLARVVVALGFGERYAPGQRDIDRALSGFENNPLTGSVERFEHFKSLLASRHELGLGGVTWSWLAASLRSMATVARPGTVELVDVPVVVCRSGGERIVDNAAMGIIAARLPRGRLVDFPDALHEVLMERTPIRKRALDQLDRLVREIEAATAVVTAAPAA